MINLLPPEEKKHLHLERIEKLIIILGSSVLIFLICLILALFSIKIYIEGQVKSEKIILEKREQEHKSSEIRELQEIIKEYNRKLIKLKTFYDEQIYFVEGLRNVLEIKPASIYFTDLALQKGEKMTQVSISGFSPSREILEIFQTGLKKENKIDDVKFTPLSWAQPTEIDFEVTFKIKK